MADTGLPWELPYPLPTDLVRDGADAIKDLAEAAAAGLTGAALIKQIVQAVKTDTFATTSSTLTSTGLTASITPTSDTSKILVVCYAVVGSDTDGGGQGVSLSIVRGTTDLLVGDAAGSRNRAAFGIQGQPTDGVRLSYAATVVFLDSPGLDTALTYGLNIRRNGTNTAVLNRTGVDNNAAGTPRSASTLTLIEVAA